MNANTSRTLECHLDWPPTVNQYWRCTSINGKSRVLMSKRGRQYRKASIQYLMMQGVNNARIETPVSVNIVVSPPDKRKRDLDNILKSILDVMTHAGVWLDDSQVADLRISRINPGIEPAVRVTVVW